MRVRAAHERYASLPWLIVVMTVVALVVGTIAAQYVESRSMLWKLAAAWVLVWLPMFGFVLWSSSLLRKERVYAQSELAHAETAEANYRQLVEQARDIIYRVDLNGYFTYINPTVTRYKGYTPEELIGQHFTAHIRPDVREAAKRYYLRQFARNTPATYYEFPVLTKDGREIWFGQNVQLLFENGQVVGFQAVARDITARKQTAETLAASEKRLRTILEAEPECVKVVTEDGILLDMNAAGLAMIEADSLHQVHGQSICPFIASPNRDAFADFNRRVFRGEPGTMQFEIIGLKGTHRWMDTHAVPLRNEHNATIGVLAITRDVTARKRIEEKLLLSQEIIANAHDPISIMDLQGRFTYQNSSHASLVGFSDDELLGKTPALFLGDDAFTSICQELTRTQSYRGELIARTKDRTLRNLDLSVFTIRDAADKPACFVAIKRDITERKREEKILQALLEGTASVTGEQFFPALVRALAETLGVRYALVTELLEGERPRLRMLAIWMGSRLGSPTEYDLVRTPCEKVIKLGEAYYQQSVQELFPEDKDLVALGAVSYLGIAMVSSSGKTIGHLCILDDKPLLDEHQLAPLLKVFASRAAAELERKQVEEGQKQLVADLAESRNRFEMFFRQTPSAIAITTFKEGRFLDANKQAEVLTGYSREELIGRTTMEMNLYVDPSERPGLVEELKTKGMLTDLERQIRRKSGEIRTAIFSLVPTIMGSEPCMLSIAHDITERTRAEQGLRERSRQQAIEAELSQLAVTVQDLPTLLSTAAELIANALEVNYCEVLELFPNGTELRLCASAGWRGDRIGQVNAAGTESLAYSALRSRKPVIRQDVRADTRFSGPQWLDKQGVVNGLSVAIRNRENPWGILSVYRAGSRAFSTDDANFLQTISNVLATAIERAQAEGVLRSANQALRRLSRQLLQVQEDERRVIARDLHDEIGQSLTAIKLNVERAQRTQDRAARTRIMQDCSQITDNVLEQVRNLSLDLHPSILDDLGLAYALRWYADRQAERAGLKVEVTADPSLPRLSQDIEITCFRIVQEALTNVARHAKANRVDVLLKQGVSSVEICVQDDGVGFDVDAVPSPTAGGFSVGLASMQERAKLLGGTVRITSAPHRGTRVIATLPLVSSAETPATKASRS